MLFDKCEHQLLCQNGPTVMLMIVTRDSVGLWHPRLKSDLQRKESRVFMLKGLTSGQESGARQSFFFCLFFFKTFIGFYKFLPQGLTVNFNVLRCLKESAWCKLLWEDSGHFRHRPNKWRSLNALWVASGRAKVCQIKYTEQPAALSSAERWQMGILAWWGNTWMTMDKREKLDYYY